MSKGGVFFMRGRMQARDFWGDPYRTCIMYELISEAAFKAHATGSHWIARGEILISMRELAENLRMSRNKVEKCLRQLEADGEISCRVVKAGTIYHINYYEWYTNAAADKDPSGSYCEPQREPDGEPQREPQREPDGEPYIIMDNNEKEWFNTFWDIYPRRCGSQEDAVRAYSEVIAQGVTHENIMAALAEYQCSPVWLKDGGKYIPGPAKWLRQVNWSNYMRKEEEYTF